MEIKEYFIHDSYWQCLVDGIRMAPEPFASFAYFLVIYFICVLMLELYFKSRFKQMDFKIFRQVLIVGAIAYMVAVIFIIGPDMAERQHKREWNEFVQNCNDNNNYKLLNHVIELREQNKR